MVSNRKMLEIVTITKQLDCRTIMMGDMRQLPAIESGKPLSLVQTQVDTIRLQDIQRQNDPTLIKAVSETINYDFKAAFETLKDSILEFKPTTNDKKQIPCQQEQDNARIQRITRMVTDYFSYPIDQRNNIQVITPGHDDRALANAMIRYHMMQEGSLKGESAPFQILTSKNMTSAEASHAGNFNKGEVLRFGKSPSPDIKSGDYLTVVDIDKRHNLLSLKKDEGKIVVWQVPIFDKKRFSSIEIFKSHTRDLSVGDMIQWSRSDKKNELYSAERARVTDVQQDKATVILTNGKEINFNPNMKSFQHWDHGYASTVYAAQGKTKDIVLAHLESFRENLTNQPAFLVALTRAVNEFKIYTDDAAKLLSTVQKNTGIKLSSLEVIGQYPKGPVRSPASALETKAQENNTVVPRYDRHTIANIKERLNHDAEQLAISILGEPKARVGTQLRFGRNQGSLVVTIKGDKQGWWHDFSSSTVSGKSGGRDMLSFIEAHTGMDKRESLVYGARYAGIEPGVPLDKRMAASTHQPKSEQAQNKDQAHTEKKRIQFARKLAKQSLLAKGSLVERYLKEHRGIHLDTLSSDVRYHPGIYSKLNDKTLPAMLVVARDQAGNIQAVQATYLDNKTGNKADKNEVQVQKQTFGLLNGASVALQQNKNAPTLIAEGTETGLSLVKALPDVNVKVTLGKANMLNFDTKAISQKTILCLDNDGKDIRSDPIINASAKRLSDQGKQVSFMVPESLGSTKQDYNDVLKSSGIDPIKQDFNNAASFDKFYKLNSDQLNRIIQHEKEITI